MRKIDLGKAFSNGWELFASNMVNLIIGYFLMALISITIILIPVIMAGFYHMLLKAGRGESVEIGDLFVGFSDFGRYFVGGLLAMGLMILGMIACVVGVIPVAGIIIFFFPIMVDKGLSAGEALGRCWEYFKQEWLMLILLALITGFIQQAGGYAAGIGILFTGPFAASITIAAYMDSLGSDDVVVADAPSAPVAEPVAAPVEGEDQ